MYINNLGPIKKGAVNFKDLVVIFGKNNSGKTMLTYLLYSIREEFIKFTFDFSKLDSANEYYKTVNQGMTIEFSDDTMRSLYSQFQEYFEQNSSIILSKYFAVEDNMFENFSIKFEDNEIYNLFPWKKKKSRGNHRQRIDGRMVKSVFLLEKNKDFYRFGLYQYDIEGERFSDEETIEHSTTSELNFSRESFNDYLSGFIKFMSDLSKSIYFPAERIGINQFRRELKTDRATSSFGPREQENNHKYPIPVEEYIRFIFNITNQNTRENIPYAEDTQSLNSGEFMYNEDVDEFLYKNFNSDKLVPFNAISSSLKSLIGFTEYLNRARFLKSSMIFIDEPEMNLHPEKQVEFTELLKKIIERDNTRIVLSTHSSFITRKLLNILLKGELHQDLYLNNDKVNIYEVRDGELKKFHILEEHNFIRNFDEISEELDLEYFSLISEING